MGIFTKLFGGAGGCREAMRESYAKHVQVARQGKAGVSNIDDAHYIGLFGALGSRYRVRGLPANESKIMAELAPFCAMKNEQMAVEMLAEYVMYQEGCWGAEVRTDLLKLNINSALQSCTEEHWLSLAAMGLLNQVSWRTLLNPEIRNELERLTDLEPKNPKPNNTNLGKRKEPMEITASIASAIDECIRLGGVALLESAIIVQGEGDSITITNIHNLSEVEANVRSIGNVYLNKLPEFKQLQFVYKHSITYPEMPQFEVESLDRMKYEAVSSLAMAVFRGIR